MSEPDVLRLDDSDIRSIADDPPGAFGGVVRRLVDVHRAGGYPEGETRRIVRDSYEWGASCHPCDDNFHKLVDTPDGPRMGVVGPGLFRRLFRHFGLAPHDLVAVDAYRRVVAS